MALETLHLKAAYCTRYQERFVAGDVTSGAYRCFFTLSDPDGWTLLAGDNQLHFLVAQKPAFVAVDPNHLLIN